MLAKYFSIIRKYVLSVSSQRKYNFYHQNTLLDAFRTNSRSIIGRNPSMVIPLLANQDLTPMLFEGGLFQDLRYGQRSATNCLICGDTLHAFFYKEPVYKEPTCRRPKYLKNLYY